MNPLSDALVIAVEENNYFDHQTLSDENGYFNLDVISEFDLLFI
mgnify:CR=1 FL=1